MGIWYNPTPVIVEYSIIAWISPTIIIFSFFVILSHAVVHKRLAADMSILLLLVPLLILLNIRNNYHISFPLCLHHVY